MSTSYFQFSAGQPRPLATFTRNPAMVPHRFGYVSPFIAALGL